MVGMRVFIGNKVFTGTDNVSRERDNDRLKRCELSQARTVSRIFQAQAKWWGLHVVRHEPKIPAEAVLMLAELGYQFLFGNSALLCVLKAALENS